jgi:hypothetical protein
MAIFVISGQLLHEKNNAYFFDFKPNFKHGVGVNEFAIGKNSKCVHIIKNLKQKKYNKMLVVNESGRIIKTLGHNEIMELLERKELNTPIDI